MKLKVQFCSLTIGLVALALLGAVFGCRAPSVGVGAFQRYEFSKPYMGTLFSVKLYAPEPAAAEAAAQAAFQRISELEDVMSDYQADSELMQLCQKPAGKPVPVSRDLFDVLERAQQIARLSNGAFDVTVGPYVRLWRFARKRKVLPSAAELAAAKAAVGYQKLRLNPRDRTVTLLAPNMRLDVGGIAKGYAADQALKLLKGRGIDRALVAASGDIAIGAPPPGQAGWKIAIAAIDGNTNGPARYLLLHNAGISTSGDAEQFIEIGGVRYSHILNPSTGLGLTNRIQATVIARNATATDALATTVCILGPQRGLRVVDSLPHTAALVLTKEAGRITAAPSRRFQQLSTGSTTSVSNHSLLRNLSRQNAQRRLRYSIKTLQQCSWGGGCNVVTI